MGLLCQHMRSSLSTTDALESRVQHIIFVKEFADLASIFQSKVDALITGYEEIQRSIEDLRVCPFDVEKV